MHATNTFPVDRHPQYRHYPTTIRSIASGIIIEVRKNHITLYGNYLQQTCNRPDAALKQERFSSKFSKNLVAQLSVRTAQVHRPEGVRTYYSSRPFCTSAYK
jgi:hypothetical protein